MGQPPRRLGALLLLTAFVGGGFGLSDLDALLYHSGHRAPVEVPHFDQPGGCGAHAEHCVLALTASLRQAAGGASQLTRVTGVSEFSIATAPVVSLRSVDHSKLPSTRAPPLAAS